MNTLLAIPALLFFALCAFGFVHAARQEYKEGSKAFRLMIALAACCGVLVTFQTALIVRANL